MSRPSSPHAEGGLESTSPNAAMDRSREPTDNTNVPKPKRLACMICRKRKLKCDGVKPSCSTCSRLGHSCAYDEVRRKSGPKRGYVKALEERLKHVETLLHKTQDSAAAAAAAAADPSKAMPMTIDTSGTNPAPAVSMGATLGIPTPSIAINGEPDNWQHFNGESPQPGAGLEEFNFNSMPMGMGVGNNFTWEMIGLGLEEPLPPQDTIDELHQIYFEKVHPSIPMIQKYRYLAAMNLAPNQRPPVCLRYAVWTMACSITDKYSDLKDLFYQRARKYVESDYIKGYGEHMISVAHAQTHILLASYEFKMMYFPRGWMSTGAAVRLCQMIGLHRLDGAGLDVKQSMPPPRDWTEREERRRTFWMAFCEDRYASIGTGWPMTIDEKDIMTHLPASDEAFDMSRPEQTQTLQDCMNPSGATKLSSFGGIVLMACLFGRNLLHLHRPDVDDRDNDLNGKFWKRHRALDNILLNTSLCLPPHMKLPEGRGDPNCVFTNMSIHTSTICLHQAAIFKADKNKLSSSVSTESKVRCISAANEVTAIMKMISHMDLSLLNPIISFCLYVAARVFVQYLKSRPDDSQASDSLRFLLSAMNALKRRNPLTESFLVQLDVDLEALAMRIPKLRNAFPRSGDSPDTNANRSRCDGREGSKGIMLNTTDCTFVRNPENDNHQHARSMVDSEQDAGLNAGNHDQHGPIFSDQQWLVTENRMPGQDPSLTPSSGSWNEKSANGGMPGLVQSETSGENNPTSDGDQSNRPTPSSTTPSDYRKGPNLDGAGKTQYDTTASMGPAESVLVDMGGNETTYLGLGVTGVGMTSGRGFAMGDSSETFGMVPPAWQGQGMAQVPVLRSIGGLEPLDAMDLALENRQSDRPGEPQYQGVFR